MKKKAQSVSFTEADRKVLYFDHGNTLYYRFIGFLLGQANSIWLIRGISANNVFISCENGLVSRFNSGDLAGKCADFNSQQKMSFAENFCL